MDKTPLLIFAYNRPEHLKKCLNAVISMENLENFQIYLKVDGPKNDNDRQKVFETRLVIEDFSKNQNSIVEYSLVNKGLSSSIIGGVTKLFETHERLVVLEDDLIPSRYFLDYMHEGLDKYAQEKRVASIHGYLPMLNETPKAPYFRRGADCWGWGTWSDRWNLVEWNSRELISELNSRNLNRKFNLNNSYCFSCMLQRQAKGEIDSWAIRWHASMFLQNRLTLYPDKSLIKNIGFDGTGSHAGRNEFYTTDLSESKVTIPNLEIIESSSDIRKLARSYRKTFNSGYRRRIIGKVIQLSKLNG